MNTLIIIKTYYFQYKFYTENSEIIEMKKSQKQYSKIYKQ